MIVNYVVLSNLAVFMMVSKTQITLDYGLWTQWTGYIIWTKNADYGLLYVLINWTAKLSLATTIEIGVRCLAKLV